MQDKSFNACCDYKRSTRKDETCGLWLPILTRFGNVPFTRTQSRSLLFWSGRREAWFAAFLLSRSVIFPSWTGVCICPKVVERSGEPKRSGEGIKHDDTR